MGPRLAAAFLVAVTVIAPLAPTISAAPAGAGLELVGRNALGDRGMNAALAIADNCAFVGSRNDAAPQVVDISNPAAPQVVGSLTAHRGSTPRELRAVPALRELAVLFYRLNGGVNGIDLYRWGASCATPSRAGHFDFGGAAPHEFFLWQDPKRSARVLLFVSMFAASSQQLQVLDISDIGNPSRLGGWSVPAGYGHAPLHSIALSPDGRTAYISLWTGGLIVADSSDFATGKANPAIRPLTPAGSAFKTAPGNVHSAVALPGQARVLTTDERYPAPFGAGCPSGTAHIVDVSNPVRPVAISSLSVPENQPSACAASPRATWTSHNPTLTAHLAFVTWYSAGLEVFNLDDAAQPVRVAEYRAAGINPVQRDLQLGTTDTLSWSYPVIARGLIYLVDINQGLLVLRYTGPHQDEVSGRGLAEGNSNVASSAADEAPSAAPASPTSRGSTGRLAGAPASGPRRGVAALPAVAIVVAAVTAILLLLVVVVAQRARHGRFDL